MKASGFRVFCVTALLILLVFLYVGYVNWQADKLGAALCARAQPGTPASGLKSYSVSNFDNVQTAESAEELDVVARGVFVHRAICRVVVKNGIIQSASLEVHD